MKQYLYELLVRGREDGTLSGAHQIIGVIYEDGHGRRGEPAHLDLARVSGVLGTFFPDLANQITKANEEVEKAMALLSQREHEIVKLTKEIAILKTMGSPEPSD
jgi:hypothetical protein